MSVHILLQELSAGLIAPDLPWSLPLGSGVSVWPHDRWWLYGDYDGLCGGYMVVLCDYGGETKKNRFSIKWWENLNRKPILKCWTAPIVWWKEMISHFPGNMHNQTDQHWPKKRHDTATDFFFTKYWQPPAGMFLWYAYFYLAVIKRGNEKIPFKWRFSWETHFFTRDFPLPGLITGG